MTQNLVESMATRDALDHIAKALERNHSEVVVLQKVLHTKEEEHKRVLRDLDLDSEAKVKRYKGALKAFGGPEEMLKTLERPRGEFDALAKLDGYGGIAHVLEKLEQEKALKAQKVQNLYLANLLHFGWTPGLIGITEWGVDGKVAYAFSILMKKPFVDGNDEADPFQAHLMQMSSNTAGMWAGTYPRRGRHMDPSAFAPIHSTPHLMAEDLGKVFAEPNMELLHEFDKRHGHVHESMTLPMYRNRMWIETKRTMQDSSRLNVDDIILEMIFQTYIRATWSESDTPLGVPKPTPVRRVV